MSQNSKFSKMAAPRRRHILSAQEVRDAVLESSEEEDVSFSDNSEDLYEPSSSNSDSDYSEPNQTTTESIPKSPNPPHGDEQDNPISITMECRNADLSSRAMHEQQPAKESTETTPVHVGELPLPSARSPPEGELDLSGLQPMAPPIEATLFRVEELPLPPAPVVMSTVSYDSDNFYFSLPPPPSPYSLPENDDDFEFPPPPSPLISTGDTTAKKLSRKRKRNKDDWKRNVHSKKHNTGQEKKFKGQTSKRMMKPPCRENCKRKCTSLIDKEKRQQIFNSFWGMDSKQGRRDFVVAHVNELEKKRSLGASERRKRTLKYMLPSDGSAVQVCKTMFLSTLDISDIMVMYNLSQSVCNVVQPKPKPVPKNKIPQSKIDVVKAHIESFPKVESHYCRSDSKKEYLDASLNIRQMHRLFCKEHSDNFISEHKYREIFNTMYNLSFHHPSKDTCDTCNKFKLISVPNEEQNECHEAHLRRKMQAREHKNADKEDKSKVVGAFDLQQVLSCPKLSVSNAYYLRKLNVYNFTILDLQSLQGDCFTWTEHECNRGTNDIATCVTMWLQEKDSKGAKHVVFYSDCCGGQNRNRIMVTAVCKFLSNSLSITKIEQKFFESGHSKNECDSMHSAIQNHYSKTDVFLPSGFRQHMAQAHHSRPYNVHTIVHSNIKNFDKLNADHMKQSAFAGIQKIHHIVYEKFENNDVNVSFSEEIGGDLEIKSFLKRGHTQATFHFANVSPAYNGPCGIDADKKRDLLKLCNYMPDDCRLYYDSL